MPTTLAGFALAGLGVATLIPAVYHAADELPGLRRGTGLAVINWLLRIGFLLSPLLIGVLADATSLRVALLAVVAAGTRCDCSWGGPSAAGWRPRVPA